MLRPLVRFCKYLVLALLGGCSNADLDAPAPSSRTGEISCASLVKSAELAAKLRSPSEGSQEENPVRKDVLNLARQGLVKGCSFDELHAEQPPPDLFDRFRPLLGLFLSEAEVAREDGDVESSFSATLDFLNLAGALSNGGSVENQLSSTAFLPRGAARIHLIRDSLTSEQCDRAMRVLEVVQAQIEPVREVVHRETGTLDYADGTVEHALMSRQEREVEKCQVILELCRVELAIRLHFLAKGQLPNKLQDLVGSELRSMPTSPRVGDDFVYRTQGDAYELFVSGADGELKL